MESHERTTEWTIQNNSVRIVMIVRRMCLNEAFNGYTYTNNYVNFYGSRKYINLGMDYCVS